MLLDRARSYVAEREGKWLAGGVDCDRGTNVRELHRRSGAASEGTMMIVAAPSAPRVGPFSGWRRIWTAGWIASDLPSARDPEASVAA